MGYFFILTECLIDLKHCHIRSIKAQVRKEKEEIQT